MRPQLTAVDPSISAAYCSEPRFSDPGSHLRRPSRGVPGRRARCAVRGTSGGGQRAGARNRRRCRCRPSRPYRSGQRRKRPAERPALGKVRSVATDVRRCRGAANSVHLPGVGGPRPRRQHSPADVVEMHWRYSEAPLLAAAAVRTRGMSEPVGCRPPPSARHRSESQSWPCGAAMLESRSAGGLSGQGTWHRRGLESRIRT